MFFKELINRVKELYVKYHETLSYLFFGFLTFVVSIISYKFLNITLNINELIANVLSWIAAVTFAYITNKIWVFKAPTHGFRQIIKEASAFFGGRILTLVIEEIIILIFVTLLNFSSLVVKVIAQIIVIILNYIISKKLVFNKK